MGVPSALSSSYLTEQRASPRMDRAGIGTYPPTERESVGWEFFNCFQFTEVALIKSWPMLRRAVALVQHCISSSAFGAACFIMRIDYQQ